MCIFQYLAKIRHAGCGCGKDRGGRNLRSLLDLRFRLLIFWQKLAFFTCALACTTLPQSSETEVSSGCGKDRKGACGVRKNKGLQLIVFSNGANSGTLDSLFFAIAERSGAEQKAAP